MGDNKSNVKNCVLIVGPTPPPYHGVSVFTQRVLQSDLRHNFCLLHFDISDRRSISNIGKLDCKNIYLALLHLFKFLLVIITKNLDMVYVPVSESTLGFLRDCFFLIPTIIAGKKLIIHAHGGQFLSFYRKTPFLVKLLVKFVFKNTNRVIALCGTLKYNYVPFISEDKIEIIPHGIEDIPLVHKKGCSKGFCTVLYLSNLVKEKGFIDVLLAIPQVLKKEEKVKFVFAGEWINEAVKREALKVIEENNIDDNIEFRGLVTGHRKYETLVNSDIFVFPTYYKYESFGLVNLEAMAAGLPVIATNVGCIPELIINRGNGFIIEKKNPKQIAEKIVLLLENKKLREQMGRKGRERFLRYYAKDRFIKRLCRVFDEVLAET